MQREKIKMVEIKEIKRGRIKPFPIVGIGRRVV